MPKHQKHVLLSSLHQIISDRHVIRACPCPMHKPRFKEVVRMFQKIYSVKILRQREDGEEDNAQGDVAVELEEKGFEFFQLFHLGTYSPKRGMF